MCVAVCEEKIHTLLLPNSLWPCIIPCVNMKWVWERFGKTKWWIGAVRLTASSLTNAHCSPLIDQPSLAAAVKPVIPTGLQTRQREIHCFIYTAHFSNSRGFTTGIQCKRNTIFNLKIKTKMQACSFLGICSRCVVNRNAASLCVFLTVETNSRPVPNNLRTLDRP